MAKYLDPKADLTFKKIFGEHSDLVISLLNALLPLADDEKIVSIDYLPTEIVPDDPLHKDSIVDVRCKDQNGRQFIVEMQMIWSPDYNQRVLFNTAKTYVRQLPRGCDYSILKPVYSLNLLNDIMDPNVPEYYHHYQLRHDKFTDKHFDGLQIVFVELPKFKPQTMAERKMQVLWLRFLTEINEDTAEVPAELLENAEVKKALDMVAESAFTPDELARYEGFQDWLRRENYRNVWMSKLQEVENLFGSVDNYKKMLEENLRLKQNEIDTARRMKADNMPIEMIMKYSGLTAEEINNI